MMAKSENHRACPVDEARLHPPLKFLHFPFKFLAGFLFVTTYRCIMVRFNVLKHRVDEELKKFQIVVGLSSNDN